LDQARVVQNAQDHATAAGLAITNKYWPCENVPRFWSDQYDVNLQMVGLCGRFDQITVRGSVEAGEIFGLLLDMVAADRRRQHRRAGRSDGRAALNRQRAVPLSGAVERFDLKNPAEGRGKDQRLAIFLRVDRQ
jgi:hypothetical protein